MQEQVEIDSTKKSPLVRTGKIDLIQIDKNRDGKVFQDPMDWNVISDEAGRCPLCGMELEEVTLKDAMDNLIKFGYDVKNIQEADQNMKMENDKMQNEYGIDSPLIRTSEIDLKMIDKNGDGKVFQDPMDWNVISDEPGRCPVCEMKLKEVTLQGAKENLVKHGYKVK